MPASSRRAPSRGSTASAARPSGKNGAPTRKPRTPSPGPERRFAPTAPAPRKAERSGPIPPSARRDDFIYGVHPVQAALDNPNRIKKAILFTPQKQKLFQSYVEENDIKAQTVSAKDLDALLGEGATHQGVALYTRPLALGDETDLRKAKGLLVILDNITDPHNAGAIIRSCAAFGASGVVFQEKNSPPINGTLAKTSAGAIETIPLYKVSNLSRTTSTLRRNGFQIAALAADGETDLHRFQPEAKNIALILGSESDGVREGVLEKSDVTLNIPIIETADSLNVSNAAAVALYECRRHLLNKNRARAIKESLYL